MPSPQSVSLTSSSPAPLTHPEPPSPNHPQCKILQINLQNSRAATALAAKTIEESSFDMACLQDAYINENNQLYGFPRSWPTYSSENHNCHIIIRNTEIVHIQAHSTTDSIFANIQTKEHSLTLGSTYIPPSHDLQTSLSSWSKDKNLHNSNLLLLGDFNAHSTLWGYDSEDARGEVIQDLLSFQDLIVLNNPNSPPTFETSRAKGWPDLSLCSPTLHDIVTSWEVLEETSLSDHKYISVSIDLSPSSSRHIRYRTKKTSLTKFKYKMKPHLLKFSNQINSAISKDHLDSIINSFTEETKEICNQTLKKKNFQSHPGFSWWNQNLRAKRNKITAISRKLKNNPDNVSIKIALSKEKATYKKDIIRAKREAWIKFCTIQSDKNGKPFQLIFSKHTKSSLNLSPDYNAPINNMDTLRQLADNIYNSSSTTPQINPTFIGTDNDTDHYTNSHEITNILKQRNNKKAPGPDGLDTILLKTIHSLNKKFLQTLYNKCIQYHLFPSAWKIGNIIFFNKPNKDDHLSSAYRPIHLLPIIGKIFEKIINNRLTHYLETHNKLSKNQFGFRKQKSTVMAINKALTIVKQNKQVHHKYTALISLDITNAFDNIGWSDLLHSLIKKNIPSTIYNLLSSFLTDRGIILEDGLHRQIYMIHKGTPQGSCLGPVLWTIVADTILSSLINIKDTTLLAYADDFLLVVSGKTRKALEDNAKSSLAIFQNQTNKLKLQISQSKSEAIVFGNPKLLQRNPIFKLNDSSIKVKKNMKYLGIMIDNTLKWTSHIKYLKSKILNITNNVRKFAPTTWGIKNYLLKDWYHIVIEKVITYGASVWATNLNAINKAALQSIQSHYLRVICRAYKKTSHTALSTITGIPPINLKLNEEAKTQQLFQLKSPIKLKDTEITPDNYEQDYNIWFFPPFITFNDFINPNNFLPLINIYTDGSKTDLGVASAYCIFINNSQTDSWSKKLSKHNSIFQAELYAIYMATQHIKSNNIQTMIHTDSMSSLQAIQSNVSPQTKLLFHIRKNLNDLTTKTVRLRWVKAHAGQTGNEAADKLAVATANNTQLEENKTIKPPKSHLKQQLRIITRKEWSLSWQLATTGRFTHSLIKNPTTNFCSPNNYFSWFLTNHGPFPSYLHKIGAAPSSDCICDTGEGNASHYAFHCPLTATYHVKEPPQQHIQAWITKAISNPPLIFKISKAMAYVFDNRDFLSKIT